MIFMRNFDESVSEIVPPEIVLQQFENNALDFQKGNDFTKRKNRKARKAEE